MKVAVTDFAEFIVNEQVLDPLHAPVQPEKTYPVAGVAVKTMDVSVLIDFVHVAVQLTFPTSLVTVPDPEIVRFKLTPDTVKLFTTGVAAA